MHLLANGIFLQERNKREISPNFPRQMFLKNPSLLKCYRNAFLSLKKTAKLFLIKCLMTIITDIFISEQIYTTVELHLV